MKPKTKRVIQLRESGATYAEICRDTGLSKSNVSYLCQKYVPVNSKIYTENRSKRDVKESVRKMRIGADQYYTKKAEEMMVKWVSALARVPAGLLFYISGLYEGEGNHKGTEFSISNSDPVIINLFLKFIGILGADYAMSLQLHGTHNLKKCLDFWGLPFKAVYQTDTRNHVRDYSATENYGTVRVRVKSPWKLNAALRKLTSDTLG